LEYYPPDPSIAIPRLAPAEGEEEVDEVVHHNQTAESAHEDDSHAPKIQFSINLLHDYHKSLKN
jgi:hypothetical protein